MSSGCGLPVPLPGTNSPGRPGAGDDGYVSRGDDVPPDDAEFLDAGPERGVGAAFRLRRRPKLLLLLVAAAAGAVAVIAGVRSSGSPAGSTTAPPRAAGPRSPAPGSSPAAGSGVVPAPAVPVTVLGHPLLGVHASWELFGRGPGVVVRIQFAGGRITRTAYPALLSGGPVTFVTDAEGALVRPVDFVPGYLIPDAGPAREAPGELGAGGPAFPGPDPRHLWVSSGTSGDRMVLVGMDGRRTGPSIAAPPQGPPVNASLLAVPDQTGYLLFPGTGGAYDARPGGTSRVTTGTVLAVGPTRWLTSGCNSHARCRPVVINRSTGVRYPLSTRVPLSARLNGAVPPTAGVISPDGATAAVLAGSPQARIEIIDLATGAAHALPLRIDLSGAGTGRAWETMVWSPDSRWLFVAARGDLDAVSRRTGQITNLSHTLGPVLPQLFQLSMPNVPAG